MEDIGRSSPPTKRLKLDKDHHSREEEEESNNKRDRISDLPESIVVFILSRLPTKHAVATSVLSKKWRRFWTLIPNLYLDNPWNKCKCDRSTPTPCDSTCDNQRWALIVDQLLASHTAPIRQCRIRSKSCPLGGPARWIASLADKGVEELKLHFTIFQNQPLTSLFDCRSLTSLQLVNCKIEPPPAAFQGFPNLKLLVLTGTELSNEAFARLTCSGSFLNNLYIRNCSGFSRLVMDFPNLKTLRVSCRPDTVVELVVHAPTLERFIGFLQRHPAEGPCGSFDLLNSLSHVKALVLNGDLFKYCPPSCLLVVSSLNTTFSRLQCLTINVNLGEVSAHALITCLLGNSPHLQVLRIHANTSRPTAHVRDQHHWSKQRPFYCQIHSLQCVWLVGLKDEFCLDFAKFILLNSGVLKKFTVIDFLPSKMQGFDTELSKMQKASPCAKLKFVKGRDAFELETEALLPL